MKKLVKKMLIIGVAAGLSLAGTAMAYAGQWQVSDGRWWYQEDDGSYPSNTWKWIGDKCYYFDGDGWMLQNTTAPDGSWVGDDGAWIDIGEVSYPDASDEWLILLETSRWETELLNASDGFGGEYNYSCFSLQDINKDGEKELIIYEGNQLGAGSEKAKIYAYPSGEMILMGEMDSVGTVAYDQAEDVLANVYSHNSWMIADAYKISEKHVEKFRQEDGYTMVEDVRGLPENQGYFDLVDQYVNHMPLLNKVANNKENWDKYVSADVETGFSGIADWDNE